jgi:hypothetical protein
LFLVMKLLLKFGGISNVLSPFSIAAKWSHILNQELFRQVGNEKVILIEPTSSLDDRDNCNKLTLSIWFYGFLYSTLPMLWSNFLSIFCQNRLSLINFTINNQNFLKFALIFFSHIWNNRIILLISLRFSWVNSSLVSTDRVLNDWIICYAFVKADTSHNWWSLLVNMLRSTTG